MKIFLFGVISSNGTSSADSRTFERTLDCTCGACPLPCPHGVCNLAIKHNVVQLLGLGALRLRSTLCDLPVRVELILLLLCQNVHVQNFTVSYSGPCVTILFLFYVSVL